MSAAELTVVVPTHAPDPGRLSRTLAALRAQTLARSRWKLVVVDNASPRPVAAGNEAGPGEVEWVREPRLGLAHARAAGIRHAAGEAVVLVDDDNELDPDYLAHALALLRANPAVGAAGGRIRPAFEAAPPAWTAEFHPLLALRDGGEEPRVSEARPSLPPTYPEFAPVGAGLVLRRAAFAAALALPPVVALPPPSDRRGRELSSGGDSDLVLALLRCGYAVAYDPGLRLTHRIPASRLEPAYLARLNRGIQRSWVTVLARHGLRPWPPIAARTVALRSLRAWWRCRAWRGPAPRVRWAGLRGRFEGQADLARASTGGGP